MSQLKISAFALSSVVGKFSKQQQLVILNFFQTFGDLPDKNYRTNCKFVTKMAERICFVCQEASSGHLTNSCPEIVCKKCGQKGHIRSSSSHVFTIHESTNIRLILYIISPIFRCFLFLQYVKKFCTEMRKCLYNSGASAILKNRLLKVR